MNLQKIVKPISRVEDFFHSKSFSVISSVYEWVHGSEQRKRWVFRGMILLALFEIRVHFFAFQRWHELNFKGFIDGMVKFLNFFN